MAATAERLPRATQYAPPDPRRVIHDCGQVVLEVRLAGSLFVVEIHEWEPRAACYECATILKRGQRRPVCPRCGGTAYVGSKRPSEPMVGLDVAWGDELHARLVGPRTKRMRGEALHKLHACP